MVTCDMFVFIDESGNTGPNLFDCEQPIFYSVAVISKRDLDVDYAPEFSRLANSCGAPTLHAAELGVAGLEKVLPEIQRLIKRDTIRFFIGEINKRDLVLTKLTDTILDSHENRAVPWHIYNVRMLRLLNVFKLSVVVDESNLMMFWDALMEISPVRAQQKFVDSLRSMETNIGKIPDARSRQIIGDAIRWAIDHPEAISVYSIKPVRLGHLPHLVAFTPALHAIQRQSEYWSRPVTEIRHHQESLVADALRKRHELLSRAPITTLEWVDTSYPVGAVPDSKFRIVKSKDSAGVQLADIVLWLIKREREGRTIGSSGIDFLKRVRRNSEPFELSLRAMNETLQKEFIPIMKMKMPESQLAEGHRLLAEIEQRRKAAIAEYKK